MRSTKTPRCPSCGHPAHRSDGGPILPGMLLVCAGCVAPSHFDAAGERLVLLEPGELPVEDREALVAAQRQLRAQLGPLGRPPGYRWKSAALCRPCWDEFTTKEPTVGVAMPASHCAFCRLLTRSGIYRRLLVKDEGLDTVAPPLPGYGRTETN